MVKRTVYFVIVLLLGTALALIAFRPEVFSILGISASRDIETIRKVYNFYFEGGSSENRNFWLKKGAEVGDPEFQYLLGAQLVSSEIMVKHEEGVGWLRFSAAQGYTPAEFLLGKCYESGIGAKQSYSDAANWYRKAALSGDEESMLKMGEFFENGRGVAVDFVEAYAWLIFVVKYSDNQNSLYVKRALERQKRIESELFYESTKADQIQEAYKRAIDLQREANKPKGRSE